MISILETLKFLFFETKCFTSFGPFNVWLNFELHFAEARSTYCFKVPNLFDQ